jgi:hypothetical protein
MLTSIGMAARCYPTLKARGLAADSGTEMSAPDLRPGPPAPFRLGSEPLDADLLARRIGVLTRERQALRDGLASAAELERNRLALARAQWELSHALIDQYLPPAA